MTLVREISNFVASFKILVFLQFLQIFAFYFKKIVFDVKTRLILRKFGKLI